MKSILTRSMTAVAAVGMLATVPHAKAADPIRIVALYNLSAGGLASIDGPSLNGAKLMAKQDQRRRRPAGRADDRAHRDRHEK